MKFDKERVYSSKKILTYSKAIKKIDELKENNKSVGLCNGGFDLLHPGHIKHLESAKKKCNYLFVSLTSDKFVSKRKGDFRPIYPENIRAYSIASLEFVDFVFIADYPLSYKIIEDTKPTYFIKGPDYKGLDHPDINKDRETSKNVGTKILYTNDPKFSTTDLIKYIKEKF